MYHVPFWGVIDHFFLQLKPLQCPAFSLEVEGQFKDPTLHKSEKTDKMKRAAPFVRI